MPVGLFRPDCHSQSRDAGVSAGWPAAWRLGAAGGFVSLLLWAAGLPAQTPQAPSPCSAPEYHLFDFWLGDWDVADWSDTTTIVARNQVTTMVDGCALREVHRQNDGLIGESFSMYDASRKRWHQSWVTNRGQLLLIEGEWREGRMTLLGGMPAAAGTPLLIRGSWTPLGDGVREVAETSADSGVTWTPLFDILFRRHRRY